MSHHHHDHHDHDHHHHDTESPMSFDEKLLKLLDHWIRHNDDHAENYKTWAEKARENSMGEVASLLEDVADMSQALTQKFAAAAKLVKK